MSRGEVNLVCLRLVWSEAALAVIGQRVGMIERAGMEPHARGAECPGVAPRAGEEMLAKALADRAREQAEICDLDGVVLGHPAQLVPPRERTSPPGDVQCDLGLREVGADVGVGPIPAVA